MNKQAIFDNIDQYTATELIAYIEQGIVTFDELKDTSLHDPLNARIRREIEDHLRNAEPNDWQKAQNANTIEAYQEYVNKYPAGSHKDEAISKINALTQAQANVNDKIVWDNVDKNNERSIRDFIRNNPNNYYIAEANKLLDDFANREFIYQMGMSYLKQQIENVATDNTVSDPNRRIFELIEDAINHGQICVDDILDEIEDNNNFINADVVNRLVRDSHFFNYADLLDLGINKAFVQMLAQGVQKTRFNVPVPFDQLSRTGTTEIYFWGIPSSGKSCALGAILKVAGNGKIANTMEYDPDCQGYDYMNRLPLCFRDGGEVSVLPEGTETTVTYEMSFDLVDQKDKVHPITCVDFAGELLRCMYKTFARVPLTYQEQATLDSFTNVLVTNRTESRKIHFFVIEYGAANKHYDGIPQSNYLSSCVDYLKSLQDEKGRNIFKTSTDAIYLVVTKVDKLKTQHGQSKSEALRDYVINHYGAFYNGLKKICKDNQINGGIVEVLPFSLGKVCFQDYCLLNERYSESIVKIILDRSYAYKKGILGTLDKMFKN